MYSDYKQLPTYYLLSKFKNNDKGSTKNGHFQVATYLLSKCRYVWYLPSREDLVPPHSSVLQNVAANCKQKIPEKIFSPKHLKENFLSDLFQLCRFTMKFLLLPRSKRNIASRHLVIHYGVHVIFIP